MTSAGGTNGVGSILKYIASVNTHGAPQTAGASLTKLADFTAATNGSTPNGNLTFVTGSAAGGKLAGMTSLGGASSLGCIFTINTDGTSFIKRYDFDGATAGSGSTPYGTLALKTGTSDLYGMAYGGGKGSWGVVFKYGGSVVLPVELLKFNAECDKGKINTSWATASEMNNDYFTVEKSGDGLNFTPFSIVKGAGNSSKILNYFATDRSPYSGISYYRLRQTDYDGKNSLSNIVPVNCENNFGIEVYPNPLNTSAGNSLTFNVSGIQNESEVLIVLRDVLGNEYYSKIVVADENGELHFLLKPTGQLAAGVYIISASSNDKLISRKIVVE